MQMFHHVVNLSDKCPFSCEIINSAASGLPAFIIWAEKLQHLVFTLMFCARSHTINQLSGILYNLVTQQEMKHHSDLVLLYC